SAWVDMGGGQIYYDSRDGFFRMNMDGSGRVKINSLIDNSHASHDGRFIVGVGSDFSTYYRDNQSMIWKQVDTSSLRKLSRGANVLYYIQGTEIWKLDLESDTHSKVRSSSVDATRIEYVVKLIPSWDGNELYMMIRVHTKDKRESKYPL
ncbi:MAG: hypothetical protein U1C33_05415, partial [Candidatus Cloacimonadaceae bacterium]|nr:hypothetical protein [Candidatus Cloacimonadaceae bacterium]